MSNRGVLCVALIKYSFFFPMQVLDKEKGGEVEVSSQTEQKLNLTL